MFLTEFETVRAPISIPSASQFFRDVAAISGRCSRWYRLVKRIDMFDTSLKLSECQIRSYLHFLSALHISPNYSLTDGVAVAVVCEVRALASGLGIVGREIPFYLGVSRKLTLFTCGEVYADDQHMTPSRRWVAASSMIDIDSFCQPASLRLNRRHTGR